MILLDTNVIVDIDQVILPADTVALSAISAAELHFGIARARTKEERRLRTSRLHAVTKLLDTPWQSFDEAAAASYGRLAAIVARTRPGHARREDIMLAGHALALGARLATFNVKDFELITDEIDIVLPERRG